MSSPLVVDIPHKLGKAEVRHRLSSRIGELPDHIPGGFAQVAHHWADEDRMIVDIAAMGQQASAELLVTDDHVRVTLQLPPMLGFMSAAIAEGVRAKGAKLLIEDKSKG